LLGREALQARQPWVLDGLARGIKLVPGLPGLERLLQPAIVGNVFAQGQEAVNMGVVAVGAFDREVAVLVDKAAGAGIESFFGRVGPPLCNINCGSILDGYSNKMVQE